MPVLFPQRVSLALLPTPLVRLERLSAQLDDAQLWMKRDDLTGLELSGNKIRKLEYVAAAAQQAGCDTLVTEGTSQSNHCRATAAVCARLGLGCTLLLRPKPPAAMLGNHLLDRLFGAETRAFDRPEFSARHDAIIAETLDELRARGRSPYFTPMGASEPLGCWGYLQAGAELAAQMHMCGLGEADVIVAVSSGATYAGLLLARQLFRLDHWRLWAVPVSDDVAFHRANVAQLCERTIAEFQLPMSFDAEDQHYLDGYVGGGYAVPHEPANAALRLLARSEAIVLDPVYTAKAFCALLVGVHEGRFGRTRPAVFIHTGGIFSDFAWPDVVLGETGAA